jgi:hypothetical protein
MMGGAPIAYSGENKLSATKEIKSGKSYFKYLRSQKCTMVEKINGSICVFLTGIQEDLQPFYTVAVQAFKIFQHS